MIKILHWGKAWGHKSSLVSLGCSSRVLELQGRGQQFSRSYSEVPRTKQSLGPHRIRWETDEGEKHRLKDTSSSFKIGFTLCSLEHSMAKRASNATSRQMTALEESYSSRTQCPGIDFAQQKGEATTANWINLAGVLLKVAHYRLDNPTRGQQVQLKWQI